MASFDNITITVPGRQLLARSLANGTPIKFKRIEIGVGYPPEDPENLSSLVDKKYDVAISKLTEREGGMTVIRGAFRKNGLTEGFYLREIGVIAANGDAEALFAYANAGDYADYIPKTGGSSLMEQVLLLTIMTGSASVIFQDIDPTAAATIEDVQDAVEALDIDAIRSDIAEAETSLDSIKKDIEQSSAGFVKKAGDTMTGSLTAPKVIGHLEGSADQWGGWSVVQNFEDISLTSAVATVLQVHNALQVRSRFIAFVESNPEMPGKGILDIQKLTTGMSMAAFSSIDGRFFRGAVYNDTWTKWNGCNELPVGCAVPFEGTTPPTGYLFPHGQELNRAQYPALFAVIGTRYGGSATTFKLRDYRGYVIRCLDGGRGVDSEPYRGIGSEQGDAIRNITGWFGPTDDQGPGNSGAFYYHSSFAYDATSNQYGNGSRTGFDASRVVPTASENRVKNIALNYILKY